MKPLKTKLKKTGYVLGIALAAFVLGTLLQFAKAWTEPGVAPPAATIGAPINTGATYQYKSGSLGVGGNLFAAGPVYSTDSPTYGQTLLHTWGLSSGGDLYLEPAAGRSLALTDSWSDTGTLSMQFGRTEITKGGAYGQGGLVIGSQSLSSNNNGWLYVGDVNNGVYGGQGLAAQNLYASGEICIGGDCRTAWPAAGGAGDNMGNEIATTDLNMNGHNVQNANVVSTSSGASLGYNPNDPNAYGLNLNGYNIGGANVIYANTVSAGSSVSASAVVAGSYARSPIYYDYNDWGYYIIPSGTSKMKAIQFSDNTVQTSAGIAKSSCTVRTGDSGFGFPTSENANCNPGEIATGGSCSDTDQETGTMGADAGLPKISSNVPVGWTCLYNAPNNSYAHDMKAYAICCQ